MKEILEILRELKGLEWASKWGGFIYAIGLFLISCAVIALFANIGLVVVSKWVLVVLVGSQIVHFIAWLINRNYFYDPSILTVAFAIATEEVSKDYYREVKKKFKEQVAVYNLQGDIKIKELPSDVVFSDAKLAEAFIIKKGIRLLIWGNTTEGNIGNAPFSQFNIMLSYQHGAVGKEKQKKLIDDVGMAVQRRMWGIRRPESFLHLVVVSGNVLEISLYTLGVCLATVPDLSYFLKSVDIFEKLQSILKERKQDANFPNLQLVKQKTRFF